MMGTIQWFYLINQLMDCYKLWGPLRNSHNSLWIDTLSFAQALVTVKTQHHTKHLRAAKGGGRATVEVPAMCRLLSWSQSWGILHLPVHSSGLLYINDYHKSGGNLSCYLFTSPICPFPERYLGAREQPWQPNVRPLCRTICCQKMHPPVFDGLKVWLWAPCRGIWWNGSAEHPTIRRNMGKTMRQNSFLADWLLFSFVLILWGLFPNVGLGIMNDPVSEPSLQQREYTTWRFPAIPLDFLPLIAEKKFIHIHIYIYKGSYLPYKRMTMTRNDNLLVLWPTYSGSFP